MPLFICAQAEAASSTDTSRARAVKIELGCFALTASPCCHWKPCPSQAHSCLLGFRWLRLADALEGLARRLIPWRVRWGCARCRFFHPPSRSCTAFFLLP